MARRSRRKWPWVLLVLALAGGAFAFTRLRHQKPAALDAALLLTVKRGPLAVDVIETGKVQPREKVLLKSKVAGQVSELLVEEGAQVKKGQLVIVLDPTDYARDVARAEAEVAQAKAGIAFAKLTLGRKQAGFDGSIVPAADLEAADHDLKAKTVELQSAEVSLAAAEDRMRYTRIRAPMDGTVIERSITKGALVVPGVQQTFEDKGLLVIANLDVLVVKVDLNQIDVAKVRLGQPASVTLDALPGTTYEATVTKIAPASVRPPGKDLDVFPVEATLASTDGKIKPGMTADVRIHLEAKPSVLFLPIEAVTKDAGKSFVTRVLDEGGETQRTEKAEVTVGARNDRDVEVVSGVDEGARILINPGSAEANETKM
jgi:membrane fusion protein, macrolide-specific efflux system